MPAHLFLEPERQAHLLQLAEELVRSRNTQGRREEPRGGRVVEESVAVLAARPVLDEVAADQLLRERRSTLGHQQPERGAVFSPRGQGAHRHLQDHARQRRIIHAGVREEVLVLGRQDGLPQDEGHLIPRDHPAVLSGQLDQHRALGVVDLADRGGLETDERLEVGEAAAVEVDVVEEHGCGEQKGQREKRGRDAHRTVRPCGPHAAGHEGASVAQPRCGSADPVAREHALCYDCARLELLLLPIRHVLVHPACGDEAARELTARCVPPCPER